MKSDQTSFIIYSDLKSLIKKIDTCQNNPQKSSTTKIGKCISCGYGTIWVFDSMKNKHNLYCGENKKIFIKNHVFSKRTCSRCN